ncbi:MAG TPA: hypothetical protein VGI40_09890 [Pirellulaceae bacterium]|jgi:predicted membrane metal-binding protein
MRYRVRTLLIVLAIGPLILACGYWLAKWRVERNQAAGIRFVRLQATDEQVNWGRPTGNSPVVTCGTWLIGEMAYQKNRSAEILVVEE